MTRSGEISLFTKLSAWIQESLFFLACFFYLLYQVHPVLSLEVQTPVFLMTTGFWQDFSTIPGGFVDWLSLLFVQFWTTNFWSSLLLSICLWLVALLTRKWLETLSEKRPIHTFHLIPAALLLVLHVQYNFRLGITLALIINLATVILFIRWIPKQQLLRTVVALIVAILLYWISGGAFLIFSILLGLNDLLFGKRYIRDGYIRGFALLLTGAVLPVLGAASLFLVSRQQSYLHNLSMESAPPSDFAGYGLYAFYLLALLIFLMLKSGGIRKIWEKIIVPLKLALIWKWAAGTVLLLAGTGLLAQQSYNDLVRRVLQVNHSVKEGQWADVLTVVQGSASTNQLLSAQTNLALFQSGVLLDKMFAYPQYEGPAGLLMNRTWCLAWPEEVSNLCWKLGLINGSLHWAQEALEYKGASADILNRLGMVYMVKGNHEAANHFFRNLENVLFYKKTAEDLLQLNNNNSEFMRTEVYRYIHSCMPVQNIVSLGRPSLADLELLLKKNPGNKMAFEYLLAYHLLEGNIQEIFKQIPDFSRFAYTKLPGHIQESLIVAASSNPKLDQDQLKKWIEQPAIVRYTQYRQILARYKNEKAIAKPYLQEQFGDTYWYYLMFVKPPAQQMESENEFQ